MTKAEINKAVSWFQEIMKMEDWTVSINVNDVPPEGMEFPSSSEVGYSYNNPTAKTSHVWIGPTRIERDGSVLLKVLFHELLHAFMHDIGIDDRDMGKTRRRTVEKLICMLETPLYLAYLQQE